MNASPVLHTLEPVWNESSRVLILGTMPSPKSRETGFYYGHPQNRFWRVMADLFGEPFPPAPAQRRELVLRRGIALWDVLASCVIRGADDASIREPKPNDIGALLRADPRRLHHGEESLFPLQQALPAADGHAGGFPPLHKRGELPSAVRRAAGSVPRDPAFSGRLPPFLRKRSGMLVAKQGEWGL